MLANGARARPRRDQGAKRSGVGSTASDASFSEVIGGAATPELHGNSPTTQPSAAYHPLGSRMKTANTAAVRSLNRTNRKAADLQKCFNYTIVAYNIKELLHPC